MDDPISAAEYVKVNEKVDKIARFLRVSLIITLPFVLIPDFVKSYYLYLFTDLGAESFSLPFPMWSPFNWRTPFTFSLFYLGQYVFCRCMAKILGFHLSIVLGSCEILMTIARDLKREMHKINEIKENHVELKMRLIEFIQFHIDAKELSETQ